jgi:cytoskeletal protein RodZ
MGVGRRLRQAREARGLSVGEVATRTKIPTRQLAALEAEDYGKLPGGIFVRGHVRAAAQAVGLDPAELAEHFEEEVSPRPLPLVSPPAEAAEERGPRLRMAAEPRPSRASSHLVAALVIVVSIVLAIAWLGRGRDAPPASRQGPAPSPAARAAPGAGGTPGAGPVAVGITGTVTGGGPATAGVALALEATRVCWLALTVDGQRVAYRMLQPGDVVTAHMRRSATLRTGDAGALRISVDGRAARPLGPAGAVRSIDLTPENLQELHAR